jgi:hypothetical protein
VIPTATSNIGYVEILTEQKLCRKGLHWYPVADKACKECRKKTLGIIGTWLIVIVKESKIRYRANREHVLERVKQANRERMRECSKKWQS